MKEYKNYNITCQIKNFDGETHINCNYGINDKTGHEEYHGTNFIDGINEISYKVQKGFDSIIESQKTEQEKTIDALEAEIVSLKKQLTEARAKQSISQENKQSIKSKTEKNQNNATKTYMDLINDITSSEEYKDALTKMYKDIFGY